MNISRKELLATLVICSLLIGTVGLTLVQQAEILSLREQVGSGVAMSGGEKGDLGAWMTFTVIKIDGERIIAWEGHNTMTALGLDYICSQVSGTQGADMLYIAIGEGTGGTTTLTTESFRELGTYTKGTTGVFTADYTFTAGTFTAETITEAGVLNAASTGVLFNYQTFTGIPLTSTDSLAVEFEFTFS